MIGPFKHLRAVLDASDLHFLKDAAKSHLGKVDPISSYVLLDRLQHPVVRKIQSTIEAELGQSVYYLNDFYLYTDHLFSSGWHVDTELFSIDLAVNAWILLAPESIDNPLCFMSGVNEPAGDYFHSASIDGEAVAFSNLSNGARTVRRLPDIEADKLPTPKISSGDILLLDPKRFHRTNATAPKHCLAIKFVLKGKRGFLSEQPVPSMFWPEVGILTKLIKTSTAWAEVTEGIRSKLQTAAGRKALNAGFFPEKTPLYREKVQYL